MRASVRRVFGVWMRIVKHGPFVEWRWSGLSFEIISLDFTAGEEVALVWAVLRCGTEEGLRRVPDDACA